MGELTEASILTGMSFFFSALDPLSGVEVTDSG